VHQLAQRLAEQEGRKCYEIPCGGSNVLGTFGYLHAVAELIQQAEESDTNVTGADKQEKQQCTSEAVGGKRAFPYDHLVFGCGSGGTAAGLAIGVHLAQLDVQVVPLEYEYVYACNDVYVGS
jgi:D-cysteine desulfhydrase